MKPFLKWVGGKRQLLKDINQFIPKIYSNYYEPFIGGGALFFNLKPKSAHINDANSQLIMSYKAIKSDVDQLVEILKYHENNNSKEYYLKLRAMDRSENFKQLSDVEKAARLIYMNKVGFNGLYRVNKLGYNNVPYGKYKNPSIVNQDLLREISSYLNENNILITSQDYNLAVENVSVNDLVYFDPPYHPINETSSFTSYHKNGFTSDDQILLKKKSDELIQRGAFVILSNSSTDFIKDLYSNRINNAKSDINYTLHSVSAKRHINSKANSRGPVEELIIVGSNE